MPFVASVRADINGPSLQHPVLPPLVRLCRECGGVAPRTVQYIHGGRRAERNSLADACARLRTKLQVVAACKSGSHNTRDTSLLM